MWLNLPEEEKAKEKECVIRCSSSISLEIKESPEGYKTVKKEWSER